MRKVLTYDIDELVPYVNWIYFHFAWGMDGKPNAEKKTYGKKRSPCSPPGKEFITPRRYSA